MKKEFVLTILFATLLVVWVYNCRGEGSFSGLTKLSKVSGKNQLNWVDISHGRFSTQIMFDFSKPFYFEKSMDKRDMRLELSFPTMNLEDFKKSNVISKIQNIDIVKNVFLEKRSKPINRVVLVITFKPLPGISSVNNKNSFVIKWSKTEDPNRLILDIFTKDKLDCLKQDKALILQAKNDYILSDLSKKKRSFVLNDMELLKKKMRIVIDAGHGGDDSGAKGLNSLKEKDITLDIGRRARAFLKKEGFNAFLTRNEDKNISLIERTDFANHLKADLFVSIHVNSAGLAQNANGIETYYWGDKNIIKPGAQNGFLSFVKNKINQDNIQFISKYFSQKDEASKVLASYIHNGILNFVSEKKLQVFDRGLKKDWFRIHLFNDALTALVEVGFLTNPKEAKRLSDYRYRNILAYGISQGIKKYILNK